MPAPFFRQFFPDLSHQGKVARYIDNHYHLEMVAENNRQLVEYQAQSLRLQQEAAIANIRGMGEIAHRQDQTNSLLSALVGGMDRISDSMDTLNATARETLDTLYAQTELLQEGFEDIARRMMEQQRVLQEIANILRRPYETKALELLKEADDALKNGMKASGRDREEEFKDATRLLRDMLDNPIGSRNYVAWFQTGWLNWKFKNNLAEAEEAFYQAVRLSGPKADLYHAYSLRHLAYMQYHQGRSAEAYASIHKALRITPNDHDTMYDAARYATKTGRESEALEMLDKCVDLQPQTIITMFSEEDFVL
ncbi:MAG: tetratricopeptide repeat protein [Gammaproteobacteria bacterium]